MEDPIYLLHSAFFCLQATLGQEVRFFHAYNNQINVARQEQYFLNARNETKRACNTIRCNKWVIFLSGDMGIQQVEST